MNKAWELYKEAKTFFEKNQIIEAIDKLYELQELSIFDNTMLNNAIIWFYIKILFKLDKKKAASVDDILLLLRSYKFERPSEAYSVLLKAALKHKAYCNILSFIKWWRLKYLRSEDFETEELEKKEGTRVKLLKIPALAERAYMAIASGLIAEPKKNLDLIKAFLVQLHNFSVQNPKFQWLPYYEARLILISGGSRTEILQKILPFVKHRRAQFWAWELMARLWDHEPDLQLACYCAALLCKGDEVYFLNLRQKFALFLVSKNFLAEAKREVSTLVEKRIELNYKIPPIILKMQNESWWNTIEARKSNVKFYQQYSPKAFELLWPKKNMEYAVIQRVNVEKNAIHFIVSREKYGFFFAKKLVNLKAGELIKLEVQKTQKEGLYKLIQFENPCEFKESDVIKTFRGKIHYNKLRKTFFAGQQFIPNFMVKELALKEGMNIKGVLFLEYNKFKKIFVWKIAQINIIN